MGRIALQQSNSRGFLQAFDVQLLHLALYRFYYMVLIDLIAVSVSVCVRV